VGAPGEAGPGQEFTQHVHWWESVRIDRRRASP
jgi:hypothetical protein